MRTLYINRDEDDPTKAFVTSFLDDSPLTRLPKWARSDNRPVRICLLARNQDVNSSFPFSYVDPSNFAAVKLAGGLIGEEPDGGTFTISSSAGGTTTALAYNISAAALQTAIRLLTGLNAATVTGDAGGPWNIDSGTAGTVITLTGNSQSLTPDGSTVVIVKTQTANTFVNDRWSLSLAKALPILRTSGWASLPSATVTPTVVLNGSASIQKVFRVVWNADAYGGAVSLSVLGSATTRTIGPIPFNANADDVADAFDVHPEITTDGVSVVRNGPGDFTITILGAVGRATTPTVSVSSNTLLVPLGYVAAVAVSTSGANDILDGEDEADIKIEVEITESSGEPNTLAQADSSIFADLITNNPGQSTGDENYLTENTGVNHFGAVIAYTGGAATDLDSVPTVDKSVPFLAAFVHATDGLRHYQLIGSTQAESSPDWVRPDDYNGSTNAKVWQSVG
jgi:hypothetical protein